MATVKKQSSIELNVEAVNIAYGDMVTVGRFQHLWRVLEKKLNASGAEIRISMRDGQSALFRVRTGDRLDVLRTFEWEEEK